MTAPVATVIVAWRQILITGMFARDGMWARITTRAKVVPDKNTQIQIRGAGDLGSSRGGASWVVVAVEETPSGQKLLHVRRGAAKPVDTVQGFAV